jgi:hypothetical protein
MRINGAITDISNALGVGDEAPVVFYNSQVLEDC